MQEEYHPRWPTLREKVGVYFILLVLAPSPCYYVINCNLYVILYKGEHHLDEFAVAQT